jgi:hypothetical protein
MGILYSGFIDAVDSYLDVESFQEKRMVLDVGGNVQCVNAQFSMDFP